MPCPSQEPSKESEESADSEDARWLAHLLTTEIIDNLVGLVDGVLRPTAEEVLETSPSFISRVRAEGKGGQLRLVKLSSQSGRAYTRQW